MAMPWPNQPAAGQPSHHQRGPRVHFSVSSSNPRGGAAVHGAGQGRQEAAGEAAGPAPAPAPDLKGLGPAPAGRASQGVQGGQCISGQRSQEQELSGKGMYEGRWQPPGRRCGEVEEGRLSVSEKTQVCVTGAAFAARYLDLGMLQTWTQVSSRHRHWQHQAWEEPHATHLPHLSVSKATLSIWSLRCHVHVF